MVRHNNDAKGWIKTVLLDFQALVFTKFTDFIKSSNDLSEEEKSTLTRKVEEFNKRGL